MSKFPKKLWHFDTVLSETIFVRSVKAFNDNYIYFLRDTKTGETSCIDPGDFKVVDEALKEFQWSLDYVFATHHHADHIGGLAELKQSRPSCHVVASRKGAGRIPVVDTPVDEPDQFTLKKSKLTAHVLDFPGHTRDHIGFWFPDIQSLFCGDTLFSMGCGRLFEGTPTQMCYTLRKIARLPAASHMFCAHEYTEANGRFALTVEDTPALRDRLRAIQGIREMDLPTTPFTLQDELDTNPFLRWSSPLIVENVNSKLQDSAVNVGDIVEDSEPISQKNIITFAKTRKLKDGFRG